MKRKRRLNKKEVDEIRLWFETSPQGRKPTIRQIARRYGVNQPSVVKSLGGWEGIERGRPVSPPKPLLGSSEVKEGTPIEIEPHTLDTSDIEQDIARQTHEPIR